VDVYGLQFDHGWIPRQLATLGELLSIYIHDTDIALVASEVTRPPDNGNELLKNVGVKFGMYK
jgi:hypothetical protein